MEEDILGLNERLGASTAHRKLTHKEWLQRLDSEDRVKRHRPPLTLRRLGLREKMIVADLGCGTGFFALPAFEIVGNGGLVVGIDIEPQLLKEMKRKAADKEAVNIHVICADVSATPLRSGCVDTSLSACIVCQIPSKEQLFKDLERIVRKGGSVALIEWKMLKTEFGPPLERRIEPSAVIHHLKDLGLRDVSTIDLSQTHFGVVASKDPPSSN